MSQTASPSAIDRRAQLEAWSPVYTKTLRLHPEYADWLEDPGNLDSTFRIADYRGIWNTEFLPTLGETEPASTNEVSLRKYTLLLTRFRRLQSLRIAYREVNGISQTEETLTELTALAEFCLNTLLKLLRPAWETRLGQPWNEETGAPAHFCILALGKLGGRELNFCSDIDLIYLFDGAGQCRKDGRSLPTPNQEFFTRLCRDLTSRLQDRSPEGFLYNVDLRLRPEGESGPLVRSLAAMEPYYYVAGQTWERLALIKARPVAGDIALGEELLEIVNPFRFPRHPPPLLLESIAGVKIRTEKEVAGTENLDRDLKNGRGGIREIEFFLQALQMINGAANPFLQTPSTLEALSKFERYGVLDSDHVTRLRNDYLQLRRIENLIQMQEERQTALLPSDPARFDLLARLAGCQDAAGFASRLDELRTRVRANYRELFRESDAETAVQEWTLFFTGQDGGPHIQSQLQAWFGPAAPQAPAVLTRLVLGDRNSVLAREQIVQFVEMTRGFDELLATLSAPLEVLDLVARFGQSYGAPRRFFRTLNASPRMLRALCLLFDRSTFIFELLSRHPEIIEEVLGSGHRLHKSVADHERALALLPADDSFPLWLWKYVKAEQVRIAIAAIFGEGAAAEVEADLSNLSDAAIQQALRRSGSTPTLAVAGLGKLGGREISFGSDLDLLVLASAADASTPEAAAALQRLIRTLQHNHPPGPTFEIDLRLRPHGQDGPALVTLAALEKYHSGGGALFWERMVLTRARGIAGSPPLLQEFEDFRTRELFSRAASLQDLEEIGGMRRRIEVEKGCPEAPGCAFKAGRGGIIDIEFLCQRFQLSHGWRHPELRDRNTRRLLRSLGELGLITPSSSAILQENYRFLRTLEHAVRRYDNRSASVLSSSLLPRTAVWLDLAGPETLIARLQDCFDSTRQTVKESIQLDAFPV